MSDFSGEEEDVKVIERAELLKKLRKKMKTLFWRRRRSSSVEHGVSLDKYRAKW